MPNFVAVERDYPAVAEKMASIGPLIDRLGMTTKAVTFHPDEEIAYLSAKNGVMQMPSAVDALTMMQEAFGAYRAVVADRPEAVRAAAWAEVAEVLKTFETSSGLVAPAEVMAVSGMKAG